MYLVVLIPFFQINFGPRKVFFSSKSLSATRVRSLKIEIASNRIECPKNGFFILHFSRSNVDFFG